MDVEIADSLTRQAVALDQCECLGFGSDDALRQGEQQREHFVTSRQFTARKLSDNEGMMQHLFVLESVDECRDRSMKVIDPD